MMDFKQENTFGPVDIAVCIGMLIIPSCIGVYFAYKDRKDKSTVSYYFGGKKMNPIAVGMSTAVTGISAITMIGYPAEVYLVGTVYAWAPFMAFLAALCTIIYYIPFYSRLKLGTIYEYLGLRFNPTARKICATMMPVSEIFYMGTTVYLPSLALSAITPLPVEWSIVMTIVICTFYTTLGGMKAVIWTDVIQSILMITAAFAVLIGGLVTIGGFGELSTSLNRGRRHTFVSVTNFDISSRMSPIAITLGEFFVFTIGIPFSQPIIQRVQSCRNQRQSQMSMIVYIFPAMIILFQAILNGLVMYAYYEGCDPVQSGQLKKLDQGIPNMALEIFRHIPGLTGMFVAAVFSGTLSTVSSGLNAYSVVILEDFLAPRFPRMKESLKLLIGKIVALMLGAIVMAVAFFISTVDSNVFKVIRSLVGSVSGPVLGMYLLGIFFPLANAMGAIIGASVGYGTMLWIFIGSTFFMTYTPPVVLPPITTDHCPSDGNFTHAGQENATWWTPLDNFTTTPSPMEAHSPPSFDQWFYSLNFHYYTFVGSMITIAVGLVVSFASGPTKPSELDPRLFIALLDNQILPIRIRKFFRFGVPELEKEKERMKDADMDQCEMVKLNA